MPSRPRSDNASCRPFPDGSGKRRSGPRLNGVLSRIQALNSITLSARSAIQSPRLAKPRLDPAVKHFPQRGNADHAGDVAVLDRSRQLLGGQLVEIRDLRSVRERRQKAGRKFERVMHRQHGQNAVRDVHIEHAREHRDHVRKILVREHHGLWRAGRAGSKDQRRDRIRKDLWREARPLRFASSISLGISKTSSKVQTTVSIDRLPHPCVGESSAFSGPDSRQRALG